MYKRPNRTTATRRPLTATEKGWVSGMVATMAGIHRVLMKGGNTIIIRRHRLNDGRHLGVLDKNVETDMKWRYGERDSNGKNREEEGTRGNDSEEKGRRGKEMEREGRRGKKKEEEGRNGKKRKEEGRRESEGEKEEGERRERE